MDGEDAQDCKSDQSSSRKRGRYSRLICLGCRARRIRCDLPSQTDIPARGEVQKVSNPCSRCKRLGTPCVVRRTILGRPNHRDRSPGTDSEASLASTPVDKSRLSDDVVPATTYPFRAGSKLTTSSATSRTCSTSAQQVIFNQSNHTHSSGTILSLHKPQSSEGLLILHALETLHREHVQDEWFRHLPVRYGHTPVLDLSIQALVTACAYSRSLPGVTKRDCYIALSKAVTAVHGAIEQSSSDPDDHLLASTALLVPFEGVIHQTGIQTRLHAEGLAALLAARSRPETPSQLARDILDFHVCEAGVMACFQDKPSPFESVPQALLTSSDAECSVGALGRLKGITSELFIRLPRLVMLTRGVSRQVAQNIEQLRETRELLAALLSLQDPQAETLLLQDTKVQTSSRSVRGPILNESLRFTSVQHYEALAYYWQGRLALLRLACQLESVLEEQSRPPIAFQPQDILHLTRSILMCSDFARTLFLFKHHRMLAHGTVVVWGVLRDQPETLSPEMLEADEGRLTAFLLQQVNWALPAEPELSVADLDIAADVAVGGTPKGRVAQLYGL